MNVHHIGIRLCNFFHGKVYKKTGAVAKSILSEAFNVLNTLFFFNLKLNKNVFLFYFEIVH